MTPSREPLELARWIRRLMLDLNHTRRVYRNDILSDKDDDVLRRAYISYARCYYQDKIEELTQIFDSGLLEKEMPS